MERTRLSIGRALGLYFLYLVVFVFGGGIGAGVPSFIFGIITGTDPTSGQDHFLDAVMFGVTGYIAYGLARRAVE